MAKKCDQCGACAEVCPIVEISKESEIYKIFYDEDIELWNCCSCFLCEENCPNGLSVREEIFRKRQSINLKNFPQRIRKFHENIIKTGLVFPMDELQIFLRKKLGLNELDLEKVKSDIKKILSKVESEATS